MNFILSFSNNVDNVQKLFCNADFNGFIYVKLVYGNIYQSKETDNLTFSLLSPIFYFH